MVVDGHLYLRVYNGEASRWYQAAIRQGAGRITVAGTTRDVFFAGARGAINDQADEAYRLKSSRSPYLAAMIDKRVRVTTINILPAH